MKNLRSAIIQVFTLAVSRVNNFLPGLILTVCLITALLAPGCRGTQVVATSDNTSKKDSTVTTSKSVSKDSTIDRETVTEQIIPQADVVFDLSNAARLDSIIAALKAMPKGVPREIVYSDKNHQAILQMFMDSLGNMNIRCTSAEKKYYEKDVQREKYISSLVNQLTQKNNELRETKTENIQLKKTLWQRIVALTEHIAIKVFLIILVLLIIVIIIEIAIKKGKSLLALLASTIIKKIP